MTIPLRAFNDFGIAEFRSQLLRIQSGEVQSIAEGLCHDDTLAIPIAPSVSIERRLFASKLEAAEYLYTKVQGATDAFYNAGLWSWLSAFYFDSVSPIERGGQRKPRATYRHILQSGRNWRHSHRHLLAGPVRTYAFHKERAQLLLSGPVHKMGDFVEQLCSRQEIAGNRGLIEAATTLYWDERLASPKRGAAPNKHKPGTLRRFVDVIQQFELTYDLYSMSGEEILSLLPAEFTPWLSPSTGERET